MRPTIPCCGDSCQISDFAVGHFCPGAATMKRRVFTIVLLAWVVFHLPAVQLQAGYDSTILSQGLAIRLLAGDAALHASLQYPFVVGAVAALLGDEEVVRSISRSYLVTAAVGSSFPVGSCCTGRIGPKVYGLYSGFGHPVASALGLDISFEPWKSVKTQGLIIGAFIPLVLHFDGDWTWAWDTFGFAVSPSVGYWWSL